MFTFTKALCLAGLSNAKLTDEMKKLTLAGQYLSVELSDGSYMLHAIDKSERLPMQFGREVSVARSLIR